MSIESEIQDLKNAFKAFINVRIEEEYEGRNDLEETPPEDRRSLKWEIERKYDDVLNHLR